jgi:hypothetical protein
MARLSEEDLEVCEAILHLTPYQRAAVHALQNRKEGETVTNWKVLADDLGISVQNLKALIQVQLPRDSNQVSVRILVPRNRLG